MCPLACTVRDGRMVSVQPNHCCDDRYETICVKGISEVQHIYGDHRVQTPLRRTGERGAGEFEPVSWDEALDEVCDKLKELQGQVRKRLRGHLDGRRSELPVAGRRAGRSGGCQLRHRRGHRQRFGSRLFNRGKFVVK